MAINPPSFYGRDFAGINDVDALLSTETGLPCVVKDVIHRFLTPSVLGPGGDDWGRDCRTLLGLGDSQLQSQQPLYSEVAQRDPRVQTADVSITSRRLGSGLRDVEMAMRLETDFGPFDGVFSVTELSNAYFESLGNAQ